MHDQQEYQIDFPVCKRTAFKLNYEKAPFFKLEFIT